ncbi:sugar kinase [Acetobacter nitrogenifigens DSM 23921 = NBRC 105050]|uniref:Adenosine kinase n=1 Tax=Acetobacter nitrogenifigens DSM 23921 = NBRC 105050 TaxID=1120919 RepID=A0A511XCA5_9PROT|nr:adenosine kinase [Acetobacter nitrogenifigens]GBQ93998.1 sugar kinase [Acetobacter nitrogenifigens DSM 23921 = NBRC 105050]GEN60598.1 adenosine kinase [Acetobacter nitrogenifigens DSM 23921 = NBRC 105050]
MNTLYDLLGIGNAITDIVARVDADFLERHGLTPGSMSLIDADRAATLRAQIAPEKESGGGSAANTCAVAAELGARVAYLGKVADDKAGRAFSEDLRASGITFPSRPLDGREGANLSTACCVVLVTPDGQRTMNTYLGACTHFSPDDVLADVVGAAKVAYLEGYLFDPPQAQEAFRRAATIAHKAKRNVALTLSDPFCVARHRDAFRDLVHGHIDILFANEDEICSLYQTESFEDAATQASRDASFVVLTRSEKGSVIIRDGERTNIAAVPTTVVDTTGAGDAYAAGFLAGLTAGRSMEESGRLASVAASEVISHFGARPLTSLWKDIAL